MLDSNVDYVEKTFTQLCLDGTTVNHSTFTECIFEDCLFNNAVLRACSFHECDFIDCDLSMVNVAHCDFSSVRFNRCKLMGVDWTRAAWKRKSRLHQLSLSFDGCNLNYATFVGLALSRLKMVDCKALEADFSEGDLSQADFAGTDLSRSRFSQTDLTGANFCGAFNYSIDITQNKVKGAKFSVPEALNLLRFLDIELVEVG